MVAPLVIRLALAGSFGWIGYKKIKNINASDDGNASTARILGIVGIVLALFILIGLFTQLMALFIAIILVVKLADKVKRGAFLSDGVNYYLILLAIAIALMFSGGGFLAFDLPL
jgi:uncharacterized membrane protein YphA (DoxX/SURF4 family)